MGILKGHLLTWESWQSVIVDLSLIPAAAAQVAKAIGVVVSVADIYHFSSHNRYGKPAKSC